MVQRAGYNRRYFSFSLVCEFFFLFFFSDQLFIFFLSIALMISLVHTTWQIRYYFILESEDTIKPKTCIVIEVLMKLLQISSRKPRAIKIRHKSDPPRFFVKVSILLQTSAIICLRSSNLSEGRDTGL